MKLLIANGQVCDGSGAAAYPADILVEGGFIRQIMRRGGPAAEPPDHQPDLTLIDARGKWVTPGFIDPHRHADLAALRDDAFGDLELAQGITTIICGPCGLSPYVGATPHRAGLLEFLAPCLGEPPPDLPETLAGFLQAVQRRQLPLSLFSMTGTVSWRVAGKGFARDAWTDAELARAGAGLSDDLSAGARGVSMGLMYAPECFSSTEELIRLVRLARGNTLLGCHIRGEGNSLLASVQEVIRIARSAEVSLNISHFKGTGLANWQKRVPQAIEIIERSRAAGQDITVDVYPYAGGSTTILSLLPPSLQGATLDQTLAGLAGPDGLERLRQAMSQTQTGWDNMVASVGWARILLSSLSRAHNRRLIGLTLQAAADAAGYADCLVFFRDLLLDEAGAVGIIALSMDQADVDTIVRLPYASIISDALYPNGGKPHPRLYGAFARAVRDWSRERAILPLETVIHKMTGLTAARYRLSDRGVIRTGARADLAVFDPAGLADHATYEQPDRLSTGMDWVICAGTPVWQQGRRIR
jgi:N-acyl-D-amino-acid deacylase